jgi:hypothetical protein
MRVVSVVSGVFLIFVGVLIYTNQFAILTARLNAWFPFLILKRPSAALPHPSLLRRTSTYASFLGISEALHLEVFHQPLKNRFFDSLDAT